MLSHQTCRMLTGKLLGEAIKIAIGRPNHGNRSVGSYGEHYQLVYEDRRRYVYLENGKVTSWQD